jgi:hypothetical protein
VTRENKQQVHIALAKRVQPFISTQNQFRLLRCK